MPVTRLTPDIRRERTRAHLLAAAGEVFADRGFHAATLDDVAAAAGFSKGAVYFHFKSKEDLYLALNAERDQTIVDEFFSVGARTHPDADAALAAIRDTFHRLAPSEREWALATEFTVYAHRNPKLRERQAAKRVGIINHLESLIDEMYSRQAIELPVPRETLARLFVAVFSGFAEQRAIDGERVTDEMVAAALQFIHHAIETLGTRR